VPGGEGKRGKTAVNTNCFQKTLEKLTQKETIEEVVSKHLNRKPPEERVDLGGGGLRGYVNFFYYFLYTFGGFLLNLWG
jgi:hypothetical protein